MPRRDISVEALPHKDKRRNIPTAELEPVMDEKDKAPIRHARAPAITYWCPGSGPPPSFRTIWRTEVRWKAAVFGS
jgi:hypothetical protein